MLNSTFKDYKANYQSRLDDYLKEYEDNIILFFLEEEECTYNKYFDALNKISKAFNKKSIPGLREDWGIMRVFDDLVELNPIAYKEIVSVGEEESEYGKGMSDEGNEIDVLINWNAGFVIIDFYKLTHLTSSVVRILNFIRHKIKNCEKDIENEVMLETKPDSDNKEETKENNFIKSTIEDFLIDIVDDINPRHYKILVNSLDTYFNKAKFPVLVEKIMFKRVNKKKVGWALKEVYLNIKNENLSIEYFEFAKDNINIFESEVIEYGNFKQSRFYKYFTTNPAK